VRLLHTETLSLEQFVSDVPPYAILSHTWEEEEVAFEDLGQNRNVGLKGWHKVRCSAQLAKQDGFEYIWIDTCCIDKSSSAELSEAINSMFRWYQQSAICYAYLSDVRIAVGRFFQPGKPSTQIQSLVYSWVDTARIDRPVESEVLRQTVAASGIQACNNKRERDFTYRQHL
jgi:hypothetical protein